MRKLAAIISLMFCPGLSSGCSLIDVIFQNGSHGAEFQSDAGLFGTGQQAIHQTNDERVWRGEVQRHPDDTNSMWR